MQEKEETVHQALYSGTEKRNGTPPPLAIKKMTRRTWLRSDVGEKCVQEPPHTFTLELIREICDPLAGPPNPLEYSKKNCLIIQWIKQGVDFSFQIKVFFERTRVSRGARAGVS